MLFGGSPSLERVLEPQGVPETKQSVITRINWSFTAPSSMDWGPVCSASAPDTRGELGVRVRCDGQACIVCMLYALHPRYGRFASAAVSKRQP